MTLKVNIISLFFLLLLCSGKLFAQGIVGRIDTPDQALDVVVFGEIAYVANGNSGLQVIGVSDPKNPSIIGFLDTSGLASALTLSGNFLYLATGATGLKVISVEDPRNPLMLGEVDTPGQALDVVVSGRFAFVASGTSGLQIVDVSDPKNPSVIGFLDTSGLASALTLSGNFLYLATGATGLKVISVEDPRNPLMLGEVDTPGQALDVVVSGRFAFVASGTSGLQIVDVSDPKNPSIISSLDTPDNASGLAFRDNLAFVADGRSGLVVIDLSNPTKPTSPSLPIDTPSFARKIALSKELAFIADTFSGIQIIDITQFIPEQVSPEPPQGENLPPVVTASANPTQGTVPLMVSFIALASDPEGGKISFLWDFGDGTTSTEQNPVHNFSNPGIYNIALTVTDEKGALKRTNLTIIVLEVTSSSPGTVLLPSPPIPRPPVVVKDIPPIVVQAGFNFTRLTLSHASGGTLTVGATVIGGKKPIQVEGFFSTISPQGEEITQSFGLLQDQRGNGLFEINFPSIAPGIVPLGTIKIPGFRIIATDSSGRSDSWPFLQLEKDRNFSTEDLSPIPSIRVQSLSIVPVIYQAGFGLSRLTLSKERGGIFTLRAVVLGGMGKLEVEAFIEKIDQRGNFSLDKIGNLEDPDGDKAYELHVPVPAAALPSDTLDVPGLTIGVTDSFGNKDFWPSLNIFR